MANIWREQDAGDIGVVGHKLADGDKRGDVLMLNHAPDVDFALYTMCQDVMKMQRGEYIQHCYRRKAWCHLRRQLR